MRAAPIGDEFIQDLALTGHTGTVADRTHGTAAYGRCRTKTGTLTGVSNLSGFCFNRDGRIDDLLDPDEQRQRPHPRPLRAGHDRRRGRLLLIAPFGECPGLPPRIDAVRVLLTNDDGISAPGLQAARRALRELDAVEVDVIAPDSNRSATARSITTRSPLTVEEVEFGDGDRGFATDGTPVDCVRFAELGLVGHRPDLIVSGINHGANLGDDITYSGTVAAAFEGIVLGIPAVAISQQSSGGGMGYVSGRFEFGVAAAFLAQLVAKLIAEPMPPETLVNVNCPAGEPTGVEVTKLGKRVYNDELKLVGEEDGGGRRRYEIYGWQPGFEELEGTDLMAVSQGRIAVTPIHFDLTDHGGLERLRGWGFERDAGRQRPLLGVSAAAAQRQRAEELRRELRAPQPPLLRPRRPVDRRRRVRRAARRAARDRGRPARSC